MSDRVTLNGYEYSVYTRIARFTLQRKGVAHDVIEVNPFDSPPADFGDLHPFGRVPVLDHNGFQVFETQAICTYVDEAFTGPSLQPDAPKARARIAQLVSIVDSYGYWPMIRQVFAQSVFRPKFGEVPDAAIVKEGLSASYAVLDALNRLAREGVVLDARAITLADCHLAPMMDYFVMNEDARAALADFPPLEAWWNWAQSLPELHSCGPRV